MHCSSSKLVTNPVCSPCTASLDRRKSPHGPPFSNLSSRSCSQFRSKERGTGRTGADFLALSGRELRNNCVMLQPPQALVHIIIRRSSMLLNKRIHNLLFFLLAFKKESKSEKMRQALRYFGWLTLFSKKTFDTICGIV
ncbi:hypothetical protein D3C76_648910 [compost metagenome]